LGITADWKKTYDYLLGTVTAIDFQGKTRQKKVVQSMKSKRVPLAEFQAFEASYE